MLSGLFFVILIGTLSFSLSNTTVFSAQEDQPTIRIIAPYNNSGLKKASVSFLGTYTDQNVSAKEDLIFTAYDQADSDSPKVMISNSTTDAQDWNISDYDTSGKGTWSFKKTLSEGKHVVTVEIKEQKTPTNVNQASVNFKITLSGSTPTNTNPPATGSGSTDNSGATGNTGSSDNTESNDQPPATGIRPYTSSAKIVVSDDKELNAENLTGVPKDARIKVTITAEKTMEQLVKKIQESSTYSPIKVLLNDDQTSGKTTITKTSVSGKYKYTLEFTPNKPLTLNRTYLVYVDPTITDDSGNKLFAVFFKFTTKSNMDDEDNPHGNYTANTNMCAGCHSTHVSASDSLDGGSYYKRLSKDPGENYCMACHDGTLNAPIVDKMNSQHQHFNATALKQPDSCTSCHNPHKGWSEDNPNMLKDHYVYTHKATHPDQGLTKAKVDSLDTACDNCHEDNAIVTEDNVKYEILSYKTSSTAVGKIDETLKTVPDYSLCLRCHNGDTNKKDSKITDIEKYYTDDNSGHYITLPSGKTKQADGTILNGQLPCGECHETHGSNNIMNLREQLGNVKVSGSDKFKTTSSVWTSSDERNFCLKCHNNSTEIYGKLVIFKAKDKNDKTIDGHQSSSQKACSECHGTGITDDQKAISAAHAPKIEP